jgi:hypothetical protein
MLKKIIVLVGPTGVGKSEFAVQYALHNPPAIIYDLDVYNPYFRPRELAQWLRTQGVEVLGNQTNNTTNQDLPFIGSQFHDAKGTLIIDCAGTEQGLMPLKVLQEDLVNYELCFYLVYNAYRLEANLEFYVSLVSEIAKYHHWEVHGIINNTNLLSDTNIAVIEVGINECQKLADQLGVPIWMGMCDSRYAGTMMTQYPWLMFDDLALRKGWMTE